MKKIIPETTLLLNALQDQFGFGAATRARNALRHGAVTVNGEVEKKGSRQLGKGDVVEWIPAQVQKQLARKEKAKQFRFPIVFEDDHFLIFEKPPRLLSVPDEGHTRHSAVSYADRYIREVTQQKQRAFVVQRLDKEYSGLLMVAKSAQAQRAFHEVWKEAVKRYYAVVVGEPLPQHQIWDTPLKKNRANVVYADSRSKHTEPATTQIEVIKQGAKLALIRVECPVEQKGQIRAHAAHAAHPVHGDTRYGGPPAEDKRIAVHLFHLAMPHPITGEPLEVKTRVPRDFLNLVKGK